MLVKFFIRSNACLPVLAVFESNESNVQNVKCKSARALQIYGRSHMLANASIYRLLMTQIVYYLYNSIFKLRSLSICTVCPAEKLEMVLASLNGKVQGARVRFSCHNSQNYRALADRSGRTERLRSMSRTILARTSSVHSI